MRQDGVLLQPPLPLGELVCEACPYGSTQRCGGRAEATLESFIMSDPSVVGCLDAERQSDHYVNLHGWRVPIPHQSRHDDLFLPRFIPQIPLGLRQAPKFKASSLFGVSLTTLLRENGRIRFKTPEQLREELKLPRDARLALIGTVADITLENFWEESERQDSWSRIAGLNFEFATSLTFSVWNRHPRFDQIFNQDRNFATHDFLLAKGVNSVPFLFFHNRRDYKEIIAWLRDREDVTKVAILSQFYESTAKFEQIPIDMRAYQEDALRPLQFLVIGVSSADKIDRLLGEFPNATIVTGQPIFKAIKWERTLANLQHAKVRRGRNQASLAAHNVEMFEKYCSQPRLWKRAA